MRKSVLSVIFFSLFFVWTNQMFAQRPTATLTGVITDQTGALIPGATVTATNTATNLKRTVTTNDAGAFVMPNLPVGVYEVLAEAQGFRDIKSEVRLSVGQTVTLDKILYPSATDITVDITAIPSPKFLAPILATICCG